MGIIINKTMDRNDLKTPEAQRIICELNQLIKELDAKGLQISSWYGAFELSGNKYSVERLNRSNAYQPLGETIDDNRFPWFLYWEIVWVVYHNEFLPGQTLLDMGGSSSLFSFYMANKGLKVTTVDLQEHLVENANYVAHQMGWDMSNYTMDMRNLSLSNTFDHITSICVFEHIPLFDRVQINEKMKDYLKQGGSFSITFDYRNPAIEAQIDTPDNVYDQFVKTSGLTLRGNNSFSDNGKNYLSLPKDSWIEKWCSRILRRIFRLDFYSFGFNSKPTYTFGALFMKNR